MLRRIVRCTAALLLAALPAARAADVPPRTEGGQALVVPEVHLDLGDVYHVTPGEDTQFVCTSDAPLQHVVVTCQRAVGYMVSPFDLGANDAPLVAGALRIPVAALKTGVEDQDTLLQSTPLLNAAEYPEITFLVTGVTDTKLVGEDKGRKRYTLTIAGDLGVKGKTVPLAVPAKLELIPFTWQTMGRTVGELLVLRTACDLKLVDIGVEQPDRSFSERIPESVHINVCLLCNTMSPETLLDPNIKRPHHLRQLAFLTRLRDFNDPEKAYEQGRAFRKEIWDDAQALNRLAWAVVAEPGIATRDLLFAGGTAQRANELTEFKDPTLLNTLARVCYEKADLDGAVKWMRAAVDHLEGTPPPVAAEIRATLERYEARQKQEP
ncbi:MAG TPA: YceI family protein [Phycisphaerae bacterium]|nr:YceI family protein [Phycisphaerae bacterium]